MDGQERSATRRGGEGRDQRRALGATGRGRTQRSGIGSPEGFAFELALRLSIRMLHVTNEIPIKAPHRRPPGWSARPVCCCALATAPDRSFRTLPFGGCRGGGERHEADPASRGGGGRRYRDLDEYAPPPHPSHSPSLPPSSSRPPARPEQIPGPAQPAAATGGDTPTRGDPPTGVRLEPLVAYGVGAPDAFRWASPHSFVPPPVEEEPPAGTPLESPHWPAPPRLRPTGLGLERLPPASRKGGEAPESSRA